MPRMRQLFAWVMVALWLPASLHCAIDRAGLFDAKPACCDHEKDQAPDKSCAERCNLLDAGAQKLANDFAKAPAPFLVICVAGLIELASEPAFVPQISPVRSESPPELPRTWQFVTRAALSPRAPSLAS
jgi:hypothetical protein